MEKKKNTISHLRLKHLVENSKLSLLGLVLSTSVILYILWPFVPNSILLAWFSLTISTTIIRWFFCHHFLKEVKKENYFDPETYENIFSLFTVVSSLTYSCFSFWFFHYIPYSIQSLLIIIATAMCAVALNNNAASKKVFVPYSIFMMAPFAIWYLLLGTNLGYIIFFLIILFCFIIIKSSLSVNSYIISFMETKQDNEHLLFNLKKRKTLLEETNKDLVEHIKKIESLKEKLIQQESLAGLGVLTSGLAHEIRNPLNFIINSSQILTETMADFEREKEKIKDVLEMDVEEAFNDISMSISLIEKEGKKADEIVGHLLSSYNHQEEESQKIDFNINELIETVANTSYFAMKGKISNSKGIVEKNFDKNIPEIKGQKGELSKALYNLIYNSLEAIDEKYLNDPDNFRPVLKLTTKMLEGEILISIYDNGIGISEKDLSLIFTPLYTTKPTNKSTGLGLTVTYEIIKNLFKGNIKVETKQGQFTRVDIYIPLN